MLDWLEENAVTLRYRLYLTFAALISLVLLCVLGMQQLWASNPVFGAQPLIDYLTLFIWGLGANATTSGVTQVLRNFGMTVPSLAEPASMQVGDGERKPS